MTGSLCAALVYRRILAEDASGPTRGPAIPQRMFRRHLDMLDRLGYTAITFNDLRLHATGEVPLPARPVVISLDEGYGGSLHAGIRALTEAGMCGVVFVHGRRLETAHAPGGGLTDQDIVELHASGFEIGSRGTGDVDLASAGHDLAWQSISRSRMDLEILLNSPVRTFAYPGGRATPELKSLMARAGYDLGCGIAARGGSPGTDPLELRRVPADAAPGPWSLFLRVAGLHPFRARGVDGAAGDLS